MQASSPPASANSNGMDPVPQFAEYLSHFGDNHPPIEKAASHAIQFHSIRSDIHTSFMNFLIQKDLLITTRANIMYYVQVLCEMDHNEEEAYIGLMQDNMNKIIDAVAPSGDAAAANFKVVHHVLAILRDKQIMDVESLSVFEKRAKDRGHIFDDPSSLATPVENGSKTPTSDGLVFHANLPLRADKKLINQRIEDDRETWKRHREAEWAIDHSQRDEFEELWDEANSVDSVDLTSARVEANEQCVCYSSGFD